jgi:hypothetical protein
VDFEEIKTGEVVGGGSAGTVYKTIYRGQLVAVKKVRFLYLSHSPYLVREGVLTPRQFHPDVHDQKTFKEWRTEVELMRSAAVRSSSAFTFSPLHTYTARSSFDFPSSSSSLGFTFFIISFFSFTTRSKLQHPNIISLIGICTK